MNARKKRRYKANLFVAQEGKCAICGEGIKLENSTIDHIIPKKWGGTGYYHNLQLTHAVCNSVKGHIIASNEAFLTKIENLKKKLREKQERRRRVKLARK